jgi:hypothetical protein
MNYMWDSKTDIRFRTQVNRTKRLDLEKLIKLYSIPSIGILIILDSDDYKEYPNPIWRSQGLHLNIRLGGIEELSPEYLLEIMQSREYSNLIWFSKRICDADLTKFIWVASHEFQHFRQNTISHELSVANTFLENALRGEKLKIDEPKAAMPIPSEFDAELSAFKTFIKIFGRKEAEKYIKQPHRYDKIGSLLSYDLNEQYDIIGKTIYFLEKYRDQLDGHIEDTTVFIVKPFDIDYHIRKLRELKSNNISVQGTT